MRELVIHGVYRHFKGNLYIVEDIAFDSDNMRELVIYRALYGEHKLFAREISEFLSETDKEKYPSAEQQYRFELQKT